MKYIILIISVFLMLVNTGCAPVKWGYQLADQADLKWPPPPNPTKLVYKGVLTSFVPTGESLFTKVFGRGKAVGEIVKPVAVAVGGDGRMAIADSALTAVHLFIPSQQKYTLLTHAGKVRFQAPVSVIFTQDLRLFISDSVLKKVFMFDLSGEFAKTLDDVGHGVLAKPTGLAVSPDDSTLYVADAGLHRIEMYNSEGIYAGSFGKRGTGKGEFNFPTHIATDYKGNIYINDAMNFRVQALSAKQKVLAVFGRHGNGSGDFAMSKGITVDRRGTIYVVDTLFDRVQLFDLQGDYLMSFGGRGTAPGEFWMPSGIFLDHNGKQMYVCDTYNMRLQIFQVLDE